MRVPVNDLIQTVRRAEAGSPDGKERIMISKKIAALALPLAVGLALSTPVHAQTGDARSAKAQVQWTLGNIDGLLVEFDTIEDEGRQLDREQQQLKNRESNINITISNFNMNCTSAGTRASQCPQWAREIDEGQAYLDREFAQIGQRFDALNSRANQLNGRIDQMRVRMMDNVQALAAACRNATPAERDAYCNIPGGGRRNGNYVNEARNALRSMM